MTDTDRLAAELVERAKAMIMAERKQHGDLDFVLGWHVRKELPEGVGQEVYELARDQLIRERKITTYHNPSYWWTGRRTLGPGNRYRLAAPFLHQDQHPLPPGAEWRGGAAL